MDGHNTRLPGDRTLPNRRRALELVGIAVLIAVIVPFVVFAIPQLAGADHSYVVLSSSMSPTYHAGDAVFVDGGSPEAIVEGDVITYRQTAPADGEPDVVTHRVVEVVEREDGRYFRTKGDASEDPDAELVAADRVVGEVAFHVPYIGHAILLAGTKAWLVALVIVPMTLLAASELHTLMTVARNGRAEADEPTADSGGEEG